MSRLIRPPDKIFGILVGILVLIGVFVFLSGSFSFLAENPPQFYRILLNQFALGLLGGMMMLWLALRIDYTVWKKYAPWIFIGSLILTALVFVSGLGFEYGGARRWLSLGPVSLQPAEFLKVAYVIYWASWLSWVRNKLGDMRWGLIPYGMISLIPAVLLLLQPDTDTLAVMLVTGLIMFYIAGAKARDIVIILGVGILIASILVISRPYLLSRVKTFIDPSRDPLGASYQVQQAFIAIGSGGIWGRGYGHSVQKYKYLPEPAGDAIFAVTAEEMGLVGALTIIGLYTAFFLRGMYIAQRAPNNFARLLGSGLVILLITQSFLNIASMVGLFPLTGLPLVFMSQGGTALFVSLGVAGILLALSRYHTRT